MTLPRCLRSRAPVVVALAVLLGLALGVPLFGAQQLAQQGRGGWSAMVVAVTAECFAPLATAGFAVTLLKTVEARKLWFAAVLLVFPLMATHSARAYHPLIIALAEAAWFMAVFACARAKRTLGIWSVVICAACTTGIQLASSTAKYSESVSATKY